MGHKFKTGLYFGSNFGACGLQQVRNIRAFTTTSCKNALSGFAMFLYAYNSITTGGILIKFDSEDFTDMCEHIGRSGKSQYGES